MQGFPSALTTELTSTLASALSGGAVHDVARVGLDASRDLPHVLDHLEQVGERVQRARDDLDVDVRLWHMAHGAWHMTHGT